MAGDIQSAWIAAGAAIVVSLVSLGTAVWTSIQGGRAAREQAARQAATDRSLAVLNSRLGEEQDAAKAKRDYEYEARKRLYTELYPLAYQLQQAARPNRSSATSSYRQLAGGGPPSAGEPRHWGAVRIAG